MRKLILFWCVISTLVMSACSVVEETSEGRAPGQAVASDKERVQADTSDAALQTLVDGNSAFAFNLYGLLREDQAGSNLFYSPYSISLALAMTYAGARGETEEQMANALEYRLPQEELHAAFNALDQALARRAEGSSEDNGDGFELNVANAIWGQKDYQFLDAFLDVLAENYGAGLRVLDFAGSPEESREAINEWVADETEEKIRNLIPPGALTPLTRLVLANAIYFNAAWAQPFEDAATEDGKFSRPDGSQVTVPMMGQTDFFGYLEGEGYQALELPYQGGTVSMVILLPSPGSFDSFEVSLDAERVQEIIEQLEPTNVAVTLPRFEFESELGLNEALQELGMPSAFSSAADFSGMTGAKDLYISDVLHKAFVSVDEEGTEAAAATVVIMRESAMPADAVAFTADHPFIFLIRDRETGALLFVGRVLDPSG